MTAPRLIVQVELEGSVRVYVDAVSEEQAERLAYWLEHGPGDVQALARLALEAADHGKTP